MKSYLEKSGLQKKGRSALLTVAALFLCVCITGCEKKEQRVIFEDGKPLLKEAASAEEVAAAEVPKAPETEETQTEPAAGSTMAEAKPAEIVVHVCGAVTNEGVYTLPEGARIHQAIEAAGGMKEEADTSALNLAAPIEDGMRIRVLTKEESIALNKDAVLEAVTSAHAANGEGAKKGEEKINLNTATVEELKHLNGVGDAIAASIIQYRTEHGAFQKIEDITKVSGIGEKLFARMKDRITV